MIANYEIISKTPMYNKIRYKLLWLDDNEPDFRALVQELDDVGLGLFGGNLVRYTDDIVVVDIYTD